MINSSQSKQTLLPQTFQVAANHEHSSFINQSCQQSVINRDIWVKRVHKWLDYIRRITLWLTMIARMDKEFKQRLKVLLPLFFRVKMSTNHHKLLPSGTNTTSPPDMEHKIITNDSIFQRIFSSYLHFICHTFIHLNSPRFIENKGRWERGWLIYSMLLIYSKFV